MALTQFRSNWQKKRYLAATFKSSIIKYDLHWVAVYGTNQGGLGLT